MKTRFILAFALVLSMFQGWAVPVDTVKNQTSSLSKITQRENLLFGDSIAKRNDSGTLDGIELIDLGSIDGIERMDGKITAETTSSNGSSKIKFYRPTDLNQEITSLSYTDKTYMVGDYVCKEIIVKTRGLYRNMKITFEGSDQIRFGAYPTRLNWNETDVNCGTGVKVRVFYDPQYAGTHTASLVIKDDAGGNIKTLLLTGKAKCEIKVNKTNLQFSKTGTTGSQYFTVQCKGTCCKVRFEVKGANKDYFKVSPSYLSATNARNLNTITVRCTAPSSVRNAIAYIAIYCDDAVVDKLVHLSYTKSGSNSTTSSDDDVQESPGVECEETPDVEVQEATPSDDLEETPDEPSQQEWGVPVNTAGLDEMMMDVRIFAEGQNIIIESSTQQSAIISDLTGRARSVNLQVGRNEIPVNSSGVYVVRVGKESKKLMLR